MKTVVFCRAKRSAPEESQSDKRQRLQGKRKHTKENESSLKIYACKRFKAGKCDLGESCRYSHESLDSDTNKDDNVGNMSATENKNSKGNNLSVCLFG